MLKQLKWSGILASIALIAAGIMLLIYPDVTASIVCSIIGIALILFGVVELTAYFIRDVRESLFRNEFATGVLMLVTGVLVLFKQQLLFDLVPILLGLIICTSGLLKMQNAVVCKRIGYPGALQYTILGVISIIFGLVIMFFLNGQQTASILFRVIGAGLIYSGISDLYITIFLAAKFNAFVKSYGQSGKVIDAKPEVSEADTGETPTAARTASNDASSSSEEDKQN